MRYCMPRAERTSSSRKVTQKALQSGVASWSRPKSYNERNDRTRRSTELPAERRQIDDRPMPIWICRPLNLPGRVGASDDARPLPEQEALARAPFGDGL